ncbi:MAG: SlyX family protein [Opitutus sp.]|nr:SlyX family protein [Opitutus sp.]
MNERLNHLEEKIAYLERHVTEQDKAMLEFADELSKVRRELKALRERASTADPGAGGEGGGAQDERPPHY